MNLYVVLPKFKIMILDKSDAYFMGEALKEANKAFSLGEIPIGAVIVSDQQIIARAHNLTEQLNDVTAHAEMQAFTAAAEYLGGKYLNDCTLYVTIEPCVMCSGASYWTQLKKVVYGAKDSKRGVSKLGVSLFHPKTIIQSGILEKECAELMQSFFSKKRGK